MIRALVKVDGAVYSCATVFAEVQLCKALEPIWINGSSCNLADDSSSLNSAEAEADMASYGKIRVVLRRGSSAARKHPITDADVDTVHSSRATETSTEQVNVKSGRSHYVQVGSVPCLSEALLDILMPNVDRFLLDHLCRRTGLQPSSSLLVGRQERKCTSGSATRVKVREDRMLHSAILTHCSLQEHERSRPGRPGQSSRTRGHPGESIGKPPPSRYSADSRVRSPQTPALS